MARNIKRRLPATKKTAFEIFLERRIQQYGERNPLHKDDVANIFPVTSALLKVIKIWDEMPIENKARYNLLETMDDDKYDDKMFRYTFSSSDYIENSIKPQGSRNKVKSLKSLANDCHRKKGSMNIKSNSYTCTDINGRSDKYAEETKNCLPQSSRISETQMLKTTEHKVKKLLEKPWIDEGKSRLLKIMISRERNSPVLKEINPAQKNRKCNNTIQKKKNKLRYKSKSYRLGYQTMQSHEEQYKTNCNRGKHTEFLADDSFGDGISEDPFSYIGDKLLTSQANTNYPTNYFNHIHKTIQFETVDGSHDNGITYKTSNKEPESSAICNKNFKAGSPNNGYCLPITIETYLTNVILEHLWQRVGKLPTMNQNKLSAEFGVNLPSLILTDGHKSVNDTRHRKYPIIYNDFTKSALTNWNTSFGNSNAPGDNCNQTEHPESLIHYNNAVGNFDDINKSEASHTAQADLILPIKPEPSPLLPLEMCDLCGAIFMNSKQLKRHIKSKHESPRQFCNICGFSTVYLGSLRTHKARKHM